jgi:intergrase/recombinase
LFPKDYEIVKTRERKGKPVKIYKDIKKRTHFHFSDLVSTHIMRKTAITTMLSLGMQEDLVRKILGHAPNNKEFFRYVEYSQRLIDESTDLVFEKIKSFS